MNCSVAQWIASKMVLTLEESVFLVECYVREGQYTAGVREQFSKKFLEKTVPHRHTVRALIEKFHETGSVCDIKRSGRPSFLTENKLLNISDSMMQSPS
jgi:transposase